MTVLAILFLAFAMSTDAFAVAICGGISLKSTPLWDAIRVGLLFGFVEALTPLLGWLFGHIAFYYVEQWGHWFIFGVMLFLGLKMVISSFPKKGVRSQSSEFTFTKNNFITLVLAAISTSFDGFAVGIGLGLTCVNIWFASALFGIITSIMTSLGLLVGKKIGFLAGKLAEFLGGTVLITLAIIAIY